MNVKLNEKAAKRHALFAHVPSYDSDVVIAAQEVVQGGISKTENPWLACPPAAPGVRSAQKMARNAVRTLCLCTLCSRLSGRIFRHDCRPPPALH